ncbi:MAG: cell division protein FtsA [Bacteroidia bacterium]|nr:cell division protein FtsA [Bacteroidia bacterium]
MNKKINYVAAVDIGTTKIVAIIGRKTGEEKLEIIGLGKALSTGVKRGVVLNIEETVNAIQAAVKRSEEMAGVKITDIFVGIAGQHIKSIRNRGYVNRDAYDVEITRQDIESLIKDMFKIPIEAGEEIIHVLPQSFIVDNEVGVKNPVGMFGKRLEGNFHIVIGNTASVNNIKKCISRVGLNINDFILEPLASAHAVLTDDEKEVGVTLVDIGGGTTDIAVYFDGIIRHTAVIPFGGNVITYDIKEGCSITEKQAEALKIQFGSALAEVANDDDVVTIPGISGRPHREVSFKNLAYIIQIRMEEIIGAVQFEIDASGFAEKLGAGIVLTGGGALLKHLPQLVAFKTGLDVRIGYSNEYLKSNVIQEINHPQYATGIGLLLKGLEEKKDDDSVTEPIDNSSEKEPNKPSDTEEKKKTKMPFNDLLKKFGDFFEEKDTKL